MLHGSTLFNIGHAVLKINITVHFPFVSGQDINLAMKGLSSLDRFLCLAASAVTDREVLQALNYKLKHAKTIAQDYIKNGLKENMYL